MALFGSVAGGARDAGLTARVPGVRRPAATRMAVRGVTDAAPRSRLLDAHVLGQGIVQAGDEAVGDLERVERLHQLERGMPIFSPGTKRYIRRPPPNDNMRFSSSYPAEALPSKGTGTARPSKSRY